MNACLTYFRRTGKYYDSALLPVDESASLHQIWSQVERLRDQAQLPGLISGGAHNYHVLVTVPGHPHDHPRLIMLPDS